MNAPNRVVWASADGFTLAELIVAAVLGLGVVLAFTALVIPAQASLRRVPEAADVDQRLRVASMRLRAIVQDAGAHVRDLETPAATVAFPFALPYRRGAWVNDPAGTALPDRVTLVLPRSSLAPLSRPMTGPGDVVPVRAAPGCPRTAAPCGLSPGRLALIFDETGSHDLFEVGPAAADGVLHVPASLSQAYDPARGARVLEVEVHTVYHDAASSTLRHADGLGGDFPILDDVVGFAVEWHGAAVPDLGSGLVPRGTCLHDAAGISRFMPIAAPNAFEAMLPLARFQDGPWCGHPSHPFDLDVLRVGRLTFTIRVQATSPEVRGRDPARFAQPGLARASGLEVPDRELRFTVALRNARFR